MSSQAGFVYSKENLTPFDFFRDVLAMYKKMYGELLEKRQMQESIVMVQNSDTINKDRAPLVVISRGDIRHRPMSLMHSETTNLNSNGQTVAHTGHILQYKIDFTCYGNTYLEAEKLGSMAIEILLSGGISKARSMHPLVLGSEFVSWSKTAQPKGSDSKLLANIVTGEIHIKTEGIYVI